MFVMRVKSGPDATLKENTKRMTRLPIWALIPVFIGLAACSGEVTTPAVTPTSVSVTGEPSPIAPSSTVVIPTPQPQGAAESTPAPATPTPGFSTEAATSTPTQEPTTNATAAAGASDATLTISVAQIPLDIPEYHRSQWKHWSDEDGDCQDARQEVLIAESLIEVTFETDKECRVAVGRWYGAFTGVDVEAPGDLDIERSERAGGLAPTGRGLLVPVRHGLDGGQAGVGAHDDAG